MNTDNTDPFGSALHVAVGVIRDSDGRVLVARRGADQHQGGLWEFPGGKVEPGEDVTAALARELDEELGIRPLATRPLITVPWRYPDRTVVLDTHLVERFAGDPVGRESQGLRWVAEPELAALDFPAANRPILTAVRLPETYLITPEPPAGADGERTFLAQLERRLAAGTGLVQLRAREADPATWRRLGHAAASLAAAYGAALLLNGDVGLARALGVGVHLRASQLAGLRERPLPAHQWVAASCHDSEELQRAAALGLDFAVLGPVRATASHPDQSPLGEAAFAAMAGAAALPVYGLGGLGPADVDTMRAAGGQGVAAIRGLWQDTNAPSSE